ncbi:MAG: SUMF1/EgtB/PvdO family nonheme iron enzyme, partial [Deltaproteobacteria bacterium]|nr:SUMF1/EgtB/PvdO family nonheme iron enzyme [Deltaproteobacteria bacterium]
MRFRLSCAMIATSLACAGCEPDEGPARAQWVVVIGTDAAVPQFGDRLLLEVLDQNGALACNGCRRQLNAGNATDWPISFGVVPTEGGAPLWVRATLYRTDHVGPDGLPQGTAQLQAMGKLPSPGDSMMQVGLELRMDCFGVLTDFGADTTCEPATGMAGTTPELRQIDSADELAKPGSWPAGLPVECSGAVPEGMVCVPGGVFLLGGPLSFFGDAEPEHLVKLSAYALDTDELTVGEIRSLVDDGAISSTPQAQHPDPKDVDGACTYDGGDDARPVNCITRDLAQAACEAQGKRLPTEAEWEFAAGNRIRETSYPWGEDDDICVHAIVARGRFPLLELYDTGDDYDEASAPAADPAEPSLPPSATASATASASAVPVARPLPRP